MERKFMNKDRRALRVERAVKYLELRRERDLLLAITRTLAEQAQEGFLDEICEWQRLPEGILLALWRYRGRWATAYEMEELLAATQRAATATQLGEFGKLCGSDPHKQVDVVAALVSHFVLDELAFDGPVYASFCGHMVMTPLSKSGAFADLRLGDRLAV